MQSFLIYFQIIILQYSTKQTNKEKSELFPEKRALTRGKRCDTIKLDKSIKPPNCRRKLAFLMGIFKFVLRHPSGPGVLRVGASMKDDLQDIIAKLEKLQKQTDGKGNILIGYYIEQAKVNARLAKRTLEEET